ncbi:MAG: peroxiredoxin family protein [Thermomicrobiales bacterium]
MAIVLVFSAWWVAGREGLNELGNGGADASLLPSVGEMAPDFSVPDSNGVMHSLSDYKGQPVWLNFWGSWCPPCKAEMPELVAAFNALQPQGLVMLAVSMNEPIVDAVRFAAINEAKFTILSDQFHEYTGANYGIANYPTHIFIDRDGTVHRVVLKNLSYDDAMKYAEEIINS